MNSSASTPHTAAAAAAGHTEANELRHAESRAPRLTIRCVGVKPDGKPCNQRLEKNNRKRVGDGYMCKKHGRALYPAAAAASSSAAAATASFIPHAVVTRSLAPPTLATHRWDLTLRNTVTGKFAARWKQQFERYLAPSFDGYWQTLQGEGNPHQMDVLAAPDTSIRRDTIAYLRQHLTNLGVDNSHLLVGAIKMLRSKPGEGHQNVHYDTPSKADAELKFGCILYVSRCKHTAVPRRTHATMEPAFIEKKLKASAIEYVRADRLCAPSNFISDPVEPGAILTFNESVCHHAVTNESKAADRIVVFFLFTPFDTPGQDEVQRFPKGDGKE